MFIIVAIMLIDPMMDESPNTWMQKIKYVTEGPA